MTVIARDAVASDHLVYAWPFPLGPECEVSCADDEQVVMCPSWLVGDRLGPGRHRWRTPDPMRPVAAFFVLTSPVEVSFDMTTSFMVPPTGQAVRLRASGSIQVRCGDPGLLIAQFVGLPFDHVNDGILRSVSRSVERMLARLLTRRVVMAGTPYAVTDPTMMAGIIEELVAYNPTAGAVFGVELIRMGHLTIAADDGSSPYVQLPNLDWSAHTPLPSPPNGEGRGSQPNIPQHLQGREDIPLLETVRGRPGSQAEPASAPTKRHASVPPADVVARPPSSPPVDAPTGQAALSGEIIVGRKKKATEPGMPAPPASIAIGSTPPGQKKALTVEEVGAVRHVVEVPRSPDEITQPGVPKPVPGAKVAAKSDGHDDVRGSIMGIGMGQIGSGSISGEIQSKVAPGARVLVPGPNGLMQSATVRQLLQGYYELEVGSSGETIWVPIGGVVPE